MGNVDYVERARRMDAALAEIGYPPGTAQPNHAYRAIAVPKHIDLRDAWRATQVIGGNDGDTCCACAVMASALRGPAIYAAVSRCEAFAPFTEDCGVER